MRRKMRYVPHARNRAIVYICALVSMIAYAIPRIPPLRHGLSGSFSMIWILFALLALTSNVYFLVGADKERSRMLESESLRAQPRDVEPTPRGGRQRSV